MSIYSNVTEHDLINLRRLKQKNQRNVKIRNIILTRTQDFKLAKNLSPITKKVEEVNESTQKLGKVYKESQPDTPLLAMEETPTTHQPIENNEGAICDVELEKTLKNMRDNTGFFLKQKKTQSLVGK